jgi:hypothetical protein
MDPPPCAWCGQQTRGRKVRLTHRGRQVDLHLWACFARWAAVEAALGRPVMEVKT